MTNVLRPQWILINKRLFSYWSERLQTAAGVLLRQRRIAAFSRNVFISLTTTCNKTKSPKRRTVAKMLPHCRALSETHSFILWRLSRQMQQWQQLSLCCVSGSFMVRLRDASLVYIQAALGAPTLFMAGKKRLYRDRRAQVSASLSMSQCRCIRLEGNTVVSKFKAALLWTDHQTPEWLQFRMIAAWLHPELLHFISQSLNFGWWTDLGFMYMINTTHGNPLVYFYLSTLTDEIHPGCAEVRTKINCKNLQTIRKRDWSWWLIISDSQVKTRGARRLSCECWTAADLLCPAQSVSSCSCGTLTLSSCELRRREAGGMSGGGAAESWWQVPGRTRRCARGQLCRRSSLEVFHLLLCTCILVQSFLSVKVACSVCSNVNGWSRPRSSSLAFLPDSMCKVHFIHLTANTFQSTDVYSSQWKLRRCVFDLQS